MNSQESAWGDPARIFQRPENKDPRISYVLYQLEQIGIPKESFPEEAKQVIAKVLVPVVAFLFHKSGDIYETVISAVADDPHVLHTGTRNFAPIFYNALAYWEVTDVAFAHFIEVVPEYQEEIEDWHEQALLVGKLLFGSEQWRVVEAMKLGEMREL